MMPPIHAKIDCYIWRLCRWAGGPVFCLLSPCGESAQQTEYPQTELRVATRTSTRVIPIKVGISSY
jgi:hypothetical protein